MEQFNNSTHIPENERSTSEVKINDIENNRNRKNRNNIAFKALLAVGIIPQAIGLVRMEQDASGVLHPVITPKGEDVITYAVDKAETAADSVTGIFTTGLDENGSSVDYSVNSDEVRPIGEFFDDTTDIPHTESGE